MKRNSRTQIYAGRKVQYLTGAYSDLCVSRCAKYFFQILTVCNIAMKCVKRKKFIYSLLLLCFASFSKDSFLHFGEHIKCLEKPKMK